MEKTFVELMESAMSVLLDRTEEERDLIIAVALLPDEERMALILSYQNLKGDVK